MTSILMTVCNIPVDSPKVPDETGRPSPAWLRPVRRRASRSPSATRSSVSPAANLATYNGQDMMSVQPDMLGGQAIPADLEALFNTSDYMDLSGLVGSPGESSTNTQLPSSQHITPRASVSNGSGLAAMTHMNSGNVSTSNSNITNPNYDRSAMSPNFGHNLTLGSYMDTATSGDGVNSNGINGTGSGNGHGNYGSGPMLSGSGSSVAATGNGTGTGTNDFSWDFGNMNGFGGEMLATEGMDTVSDGLRGGEQNQGL